ncbi:MAG: tetratricopeptide repeat protein [bacterium]|nr:tetratricopeptide repeat protein [bacterium]
MKFIYSLLLFLLIAAPLPSDILETREIPTGVRPVGMGETFTGIADDSTAIRWNPAGLGQLKHSEISGMFASLYGSGAYNTYVSFAMPFQKINTIAVDWLYTGYNEEDEFTYDGVPELGYGEHFIYAAFARQVYKKIYAGASLKYYSINVNYDGENWASGQGFGADIGGLWRLNEQLTVGLTVKNILPLTVNYSKGKAQTILEPSLTVGAGYSPLKKLLIGLDLNDSAHLGAEYWIINLLAVRGGIIKGLTYENKDNFTFNLGAGLRYKFSQLDYAYSYNPDLIATHRVAATFAWGYHAYLVDVLTVSIKDMFASLYKVYAKENIVRVVVQNKTQKPLDASVGIYISGLMKSPTSRKQTLEPGKPTEVLLPVVFSDDVLEVRDDVTRAADIVVSYEYDDRLSEDVTPGNFILYNRNAFIWDDFDKIAGFVTPQDDRIKEFARASLQSIRSGRIKDEFISGNFYKALAIFNSFGTWGMTYIADPNRPYSSTAGNRAAIDYIQYPQESLKQKSGDCDDCVVLYSSALENVGVATALIDVPGHIFMMFDSGLTPEEAGKKLINEDMYVESAGKVWIPVETTMFGGNFFEAWKEAGQDLKQWSAEQSRTKEDILRVCYVQDAWTRYPSGSIPEDKFNVELKPDKIKNQMKEDYDKILNAQNREYGDLQNAYRKAPSDPVLNNKIGIYYARNGVYTLAERFFQESLKGNRNNIAAYNNLGNLYLMAGDRDNAIRQYQEGLKISPNDGELLANLERARNEK